MESGEHAGDVWEHKLTQAHKLVSMHTMFFHAQDNISAILDQIREQGTYQIMGICLSCLMWSKHTWMCASTPYSGMHRPISPHNGSDQINHSIYGEHCGHFWTHNMTKVHKLACKHAIFLCTWAHIIAIFGWICDIKVSVESGEHAGVVWAHMTQAHKVFCMHTTFLNTISNRIRSERSR